MVSSAIDLRLSSHFTLAEATKSQLALRHGIDNRPPAEAIANMAMVAAIILEPVRARFGRAFSPSSFYRSPALNRKIGGAPSSQHLLGEAVDFEIPGISNHDVARWIAAELPFDQLILEYYTPDTPQAGWVHVSYRAEGPLRHEILRFDGKQYQRGLA